MKRYFLTLTIITILMACGPVPQAQEVEATTALGNPDPMVVSCVSGYYRAAPNFCRKETSLSAFTLTLDSTCRNATLTSFDTFPTSARTAILVYHGVIRSANAIATRQLAIDFYNDVSCTQPFYLPIVFIGREFAAVAATNILDGGTREIEIPLDGTARLYYFGALTNCVGCVFEMAIVGYND